ncbi:MAG: hypothetical protein KI790_01570 [Cyclobacteriaceae bacterium]|nr:hypothetical protein [Cyclobacteriaceae bacterium HetDA_MAG_MS6]
MLLVLLFSFFLAKSEGSKNLSPDSTGTTTGTNDIVGFLCHTQGNGNGGITGPFMSPSATADERLKVYIETDETLYMGFRRMASTFSGTITFGDLNVILRESDGTFVTSFLILADQSSVSGGLQDYAFQSPQNGVIDTYAEALAGPSTVVGSSGYSPISWTNNSGLGSQEFYIQVVQSTSGSGTVTSEADGNAIFVESRYDLWDISVYDGTTEKPGRLFCKSWGFTTTSFANQFSDDFQLFINIPSTVGGSSAGFYVKELDLAGLQPFTTSVFANSVGAEIAQTTDLNGDGSIDFQDARRSQGSNIADLEYDIFINNPDIDIYPTTTLPSVNITDAVFYCNSGGTAGEGVITIETNQSGVVGLVLDLDGAAGYDAGGTDVIIEATVDASSGSGTATIRWDGLDGTGSAVASGATINITGRFTAGPLHVPLWDPEQNVVGINMLDVRPQTSFDLIYWDDRSTTLDSSPNVELTGTNTGQHTWTDPSGTGAGGGNAVLVNTWSFGYFQSNTQNVAFTYACDTDGDGINDGSDSDSDNDGIADAVEGNFKNDTDADGIPDYLDADFAGYADTNADGVNDNFDTDLDGIPDALDVDSDNDGIPDMVENGLADTDLDGTVDNGSGITDTNDNGLDDNYDPACDGATVSGNATAQTNTGATNPANALGNTPGTFAEIASGDILTLDIGQIVPSGVTIVLSLNDGAAGINATANVSQSEDGTNFTNVQGYTATTGVDTAPFGPEDFNYVLTADARYIRLVEASGANRPVDVHMLSFSYTNCSGGSAVAIVDTDSDAISNYLDLDSDNDGIVDVLEVGGTVAATSGQINGFTDSNGNGLNDAQESVALSLTNTDGDGSLADYLDIDSDNDGILDNIEAQASNAVITIAAGDTDSDGLLDVYDPNNGGILLIPVDTDTDGADDYLDTDADGDGVADLIEGWDSDFNGFNDLESTTNDNDLSDETGYNVDADTDGLWDIYESSTAPVQNTDGAGLSDWQDTDDDDDGSLTSGEDVNSNNNWTDDKTQGQGAGSPLPDYLYRGDYDGDAIADGNDADSDNDGLTDATEDNGESIDPSGDEDNDGIANYRDTDDTGVTDNIVEVDSNSDGVWDNYDSDLDGIPDFLDLDSDGDGIWDAVEANGGAVPFGLNETTGQFELQDPDNDGLMNYVDTDDVSSSNPTSDLSNPDSDGDGLSDYQDIDSDGDGIPDNIEAQLTTTYVAPANNDADGDGIDDSYDPGSGGTKLDPVNSDTQDFQDYRDTDSDNDNVEDIVEGWDQDANGRGDWDDDLDGNQDEADLATDSDGDGLADAFDNVALGTTGNEAGSAATRQNTDGIDFPDWRDDNDDNDAANTIDEDNNSDGIYWNDQTGGQSGSIPDYLYNGDFDRDLIADTPDTDSDNDGIPDIDEDNGESVDPSGDIDGDGIPNFRDDDDPGVLNNIVEVDSNGDGVWDNYDSDLDGLPDFRDRDSDNDGIADLVEAGGVESDGDGVVDGLTDTDSDGIPDNVDVDQTGGNDSDSDGIDDLFDFSVAGGTDTDGDDIIDSADLDRDGDGLVNTYDADPDDNGVVTTTLSLPDSDGDGLANMVDLDSDNDGIPDIIEAGGVDSNGDGQVDIATDTDLDGMSDVVDTDNGGTALAIPDTDVDGIADYLDVDSDNDGITDTVENGGEDTNNDGLIDGNSSDTDGDGLANVVDPDNGGTPIANVDTDNDGIADFRDLDVDNDGYPDILEAGGSDSDNDGIVNTTLNSDPLDDAIPDNVDVDYSGTNGGSGIDSDGDEIDNSFDVDQTGGIDTDGDGIDDTYDTDVDGNGYDDAVEATPYGQEDKEGDGNKDFRDIDSDGDGIADVVEFGETVNAANAQIDGFTDSNRNGWNDAQESTPITPPNTDGDALANYRDIDSDNDGIPDNIESQTATTYAAISNNDTDADGLDDVYDPDNGGSIITPRDTDGTGNDDYLDTDADDDTVPDNIEGDNDDLNQYADWDTDNDNVITDEVGYNIDTDADGLWDVFDNNSSTTSVNVTGSNSDGQDTDSDGSWDFQDNDDDGDGLLTSSQGGGNEDSDSDGDPTNDFDDDDTNTIPNYLYGTDDGDGDSVADDVDLDSDNDGLVDTSEDGGTGIDPSGDIDGDQIPNGRDADMDGDGIANISDSDANGDSTPDSFTLTDSNNDGIADQFDKDLDGVPDYQDLDSDNDGITDLLEFGLTDSNQDGTLDEGAGLTDSNGNGLADSADPACDGASGSGNATAQTNTGATNPANAIGNTPGTFAEIANSAVLTLDMGEVVPSGNTIVLSLNDGAAGINAIADVSQSEDGTSFTNVQRYTATTGVDTAPIGPENFNYVLTSDARYIRLTEASGANRPVDVHLLSFSYTNCSGGTAVTISDTDADGIANHLDLDSDNDGITDNREAQTTASYIAPAAGDTDGDGILDVYDANN